MITSENAEIMDTIDRAFEQMGGRATKPELLAIVAGMLPSHLNDHLVNAGLSAKIGQYFRAPSSGLPQAPEIDTQGTHVQRELFSVEEYRFCVERHMRSSNTEQAQAEKFAAECEDRRGVRIDLTEFIADAS